MPLNFGIDAAADDSFLEAKIFIEPPKCQALKAGGGMPTMIIINF